MARRYIVSAPNPFFVVYNRMPNARKLRTPGRLFDTGNKRTGISL